jgi:hypothetical protein
MGGGEFYTLHLQFGSRSHTVGKMTEAVPPGLQELLASLEDYATAVRTAPPAAREALNYPD